MCYPPMRTLIQRYTAAVVVLLSLAATSSAQTADEVIDKSIAAMGGRAAFEKIKSRRATGTLTIGTPGGDVAGTVEILAAPPNKQRTVVKADLSKFGMIEEFSGVMYLATVVSRLIALSVTSRTAR